MHLRVYEWNLLYLFECMRKFFRSIQNYYSLFSCAPISCLQSLISSHWRANNKFRKQTKNSWDFVMYDDQNNFFFVLFFDIYEMFSLQSYGKYMYLRCIYVMYSLTHHFNIFIDFDAIFGSVIWPFYCFLSMHVILLHSISWEWSEEKK